MVVGEDDAGASMPHRILDDRTEREGGVAFCAVVPRQVHAVRPIVDMRHPQALSSGIGLGEATREKGAGRLGSVQLERLCGTLIAHPA